MASSPFTIHTALLLLLPLLFVCGITAEEKDSHPPVKGDGTTSEKEEVQKSPPNVVINKGKDATSSNNSNDSTNASSSSDGLQKPKATGDSSDKLNDYLQNQTPKEKLDGASHDKNSDSELSKNDPGKQKSGPNKDPQSTKDTNNQKSGGDSNQKSNDTDKRNSGGDPNKKSNDVDKQNSGGDPNKNPSDTDKHNSGGDPNKKSNDVDKQNSGGDPNKKSNDVDKHNSGGDPNKKSNDVDKRNSSDDGPNQRSNDVDKRNSGGDDPNQKSNDADKQKSGGNDPNQELNDTDKRNSDSGPKKTPENVKTQEQTDCNHSCGDEKKMLACLLTPGEGMHELSLLVQNKGDTPLHVEVTAPDFLSADPPDALVIEKGKSATVKFTVVDVKEAKHAGSPKSDSPKINIKGDSQCSIDVPATVYLEKLSQRRFFQGISYPYMTKHVLLVYILIFVLAGTGVGTWLSCRYSRKRCHADGVRYQELEIGDIHQQTVSKPEEEALDGWDEVWDEDWEDTEAARLTSRPMRSVSSNGLASRRGNKEGWEISWDDQNV